MIPNYDIKSQSESYGTYTPEVPTMSMMFPKRNQRRWKFHWSWRATFATVNLQEQVHLATELCGTWIARNSHGLSIDYHPDVISVSGGQLFKHSRYMIRRHGWWLLHVGGLLASIILEPPYVWKVSIYYSFSCEQPVLDNGRTFSKNCVWLCFRKPSWFLYRQSWMLYNLCWTISQF